MQLFIYFQTQNIDFFSTFYYNILSIVPSLQWQYFKHKNKQNIIYYYRILLLTHEIKKIESQINNKDKYYRFVEKKLNNDSWTQQ